MIEVCYLLDETKIVMQFETLGQAKRSARRGSFGVQMIVRDKGRVVAVFSEGNEYDRDGNLVEAN